MINVTTNEVKKYLDPAIIFLRRCGYDNNCISYIILEILFNFSPTEEEINNSKIPHPVPCDSDNIPEYIEKAMDEIDCFKSKEIDEGDHYTDYINTNFLSVRKEDEFF